MGANMTKMVMRGVLAILAMGIFGLALWGLLTIDFPDGSKEVLFVIIGALVGILKDITGYYYGASIDGNGHEEPRGDKKTRFEDTPKAP